MDIDILRNFCKQLPAVTEDIKWGNDLCFCIGGKMFCVASLTSPLTVSLKVKDEEFAELSNREGISPAPYVAKHKWILVINLNSFSKKEWEKYIHQSYELVRARLTKKLQRELEASVAVTKAKGKSA